MSNNEIESLRQALDQATRELPKVSWRRMFGCDAVFADGTIFGLIWKSGRIGIKLPAEKEFDTLMAMKGSEPWKAGPMTMAHWVLVPQEMSHRKSALAGWAKKGHELALLNPKVKKTAKR